MAAPPNWWKDQQRRRARLLDEWRATQARDYPPVLRSALEFIVRSKAQAESGHDRPARLWLDASDIRLAKQRVVSQARRLRFGAIPDDATVWGEQILMVAASLGIDITLDEMQSPPPEVEP